jgi:hypothetical protein
VDAGTWPDDDASEGSEELDGSDSEDGAVGFDEAYSPNMRSDGRSTGSGVVCETLGQPIAVHKFCLRPTLNRTT